MYCPFRQLASMQTRHVEKMVKCNPSEHAQSIETSDSVTVDTVVCEPENEAALSTPFSVGKRDGRLEIEERISVHGCDAAH